MNFLKLASTAITLILSTSANATLITYEFSGTLAGLQGQASSMFSSATIGDSFSIRISLDDTLADQVSNTNNGTYGDYMYAPPGQPAGFSSVINAQLIIGSEMKPFTWAGGTVGAQQQFKVYDGQTMYYGSGAIKQWEGLSFTAQPTTGRSSSNNYYAGLNFVDIYDTGTNVTGSAGILPSDALPVRLGGLPGTGSFYYFFENPNSTDFDSYIGGNITGLSINGVPVSPVPLPTAVWLFGSGLIGLAGIARKKKVA